MCKDIFAWDWGLWLSGDKFLTGHHNRNLTGSIAVETDEWTHVAVTYNNGTHKLYVNGLEDTLAGNQSKITQSTYDIAFGRRAGCNFEGSLDEIALFDKALSAAEITLLVNAGTDRDKRLSTLVYQAEDNTSQGGGSITTTYPGYFGTGYIDFGGKDSYVEWDRIFTSAGTAQLKFRYANGSSVDRTCSLVLNDLPYGTLTFPPTGSWDT